MSQTIQFTRRDFMLGISGIGAAGFSKFRTSAYRAVLFDAFPVFDPRPVFSLVSQLFPEKGSELSNIWKVKQFEYTWLRTAAKQYKDFWHVTEDALAYASKATGVSLAPGEKDRIMSTYLSLDIWPDVLPALQVLKEKGLQAGFLSNMTETMLGSCMKYSKTEQFFSHVLSTDLVKTYKPDAKAYQMAIDHLQLKKEEILFVAFAPWDVAGAKWFGYPTFWVNRIHSASEELDISADSTGTSLSDLIAFLHL